MRATTEADDLGISDGVRRSKGRASRDGIASARVTSAEQQELEAAAKAQGKALSEWAREVLLQEARAQVNERALFTEVVALRMLLNTTMRLVLTGQRLSDEQLDQIAGDINSKKHDKALDIRAQYKPTGDR